MVAVIASARHNREQQRRARIRYLLGDDGFSLAEHERAALDELRGLLAAPAVWEDPPPSLEDALVAAITIEAGAPSGATRLRWRGIARRPAAYGRRALAGAAGAMLVAVAIVLGTGGAGPAPSRFAMIVSGTRLAPAAHGHAALTKMPSGWEVKLAVTGLPHLAGSRYYAVREQVADHGGRIVKSLGCWRCSAGRPARFTVRRRSAPV